jgi:transcriptional regulator with XRE-family HTH domain
MVTRLRVRELAEERKLNLSQLQRQSGATMPSIRRYWYNSKDGRAEGSEPLREVDLRVLESIARVLGVKVRDLFSEEDKAALWPATA